MSLRGQARVRVTVQPGEDVLLPAGQSVAALRGPLAELLRRPEVRHLPLVVDGAAVPDDAVAGEWPLVTGAVVRFDDDGGRSAGADPDATAMRARWTVARASGVGAGELVGVEPGTSVRLGPGVKVRVGCRGGVRVRTQWRGGGGASLVPLGSGVSGGRPRRVTPLGRRWDVERVLKAGDSMTLHRGGSPEVALADVASRADASPPAAAAVTGPSTAITLATGLLPVVGSVGLAVALRQPTFALFSLVGLLTTFPQVVAAARRRRAGTGSGVQGRSAVDPGRLARATAAALLAPATAWQDAVRAQPGHALPSGGAGPTAHGGTALPVPDGALAVRGPQHLARAAASAVVAELAARGAGVLVVGEGRPAWSWCRWLVDDGGAEATARFGEDGRRPGRVVVADEPGADDLDAAREAHRAGDVVVLCLRDGAQVPSWCRDVLDVSADDAGRPVAVRVRSGGAGVEEPFVGLTAARAARLARRLAAGRALGRDVADLWAAPSAGALDARGLPAGADPGNVALPAVVPLTSLVTASNGTASNGVAAGGAAPWSVPLGLDAAGRVVAFDLVADGPHLLVAGTTGAGKSELLQALVLALALRRRPEELALALVDFKGGASFGACAGLPHVVGQVTDLDTGLASRALEGLRAELRRRKEALAAHGVAEVEALPPGVLPRLVVVVDEFRALADDLPDLLPGLLRVAAQGRSLGVHLVLATQRPAGAVSADVRANVSARLALRVVDVADSLDVLDSPAAAHVPPGVPGRAVLRLGAAAPVALQCAYAGAADDGSSAGVERATAWDDEPVAAPPAPVAADVDAVQRLVDRAWSAAGGRPSRWPAPWLPPLPATVPLRDLAPSDGARLPLGLGDSPGTQSRVDVAWAPSSGHLAILGRARSGRTTALATLAHAALAAGWHVHALVPASASEAFAHLRAHPAFGTLAGPGDVRRCRRLLRLVQQPAAARPTARVLVLVDGVEELRHALAVPGDDPLATALGSGAAAFAVTADSAGLGGLSSRFGPRLALLSTDATADVMLGAPSPLAGRGRTPGRGAWLGAGDPVECQVAVAPDEPIAAARDVDASAPVRVLPLPRHLPLLALPGTPDPAAPSIGIGGDDARSVTLDVAAGALVVGARGSGRTSTLRTILAGLTGEVVVVGRARALCDDAAARGARVVAPTTAGLRSLLDDLAAVPPAHSPRPVVLVDDADVLTQSFPLEADALAELAADGAIAVVGTATTMNVCLAHRGLLAQLRATRAGLVLTPGERGAEDVFGAPLGDATEPGVNVPGRAALVEDDRATAVQVADPGPPGPPAATAARAEASPIDAVVLRP